jgi:hypothetical protein
MGSFEALRFIEKIGSWARLQGNGSLNELVEIRAGFWK